jgi:hypothetical protein
MNETDIQERISDILVEMTDLATDAELSYGEILIEVALAMIRECTGQDLTAEERNKEIAQFLAAIQQRAEAPA